MFTEKKKSLFSVPTSGTATTANLFVHEGLKKSSETLSGNAANKFSTTGNGFVDQFGSLGNYRAIRSFIDISKDMIELWSLSAVKAIMFVFFLRMITRVVSFWEGLKTSTVQKGSGLKHEGIMRMIWIAINYPDTFSKNIKLYIAIASWKDIFEMLRYDLEYNGWEGRKLNWEALGTLILAGLENPNTTNLVKKYLPQLQARSKCKTVRAQANTMIAKWIANKLDLSYKDYRKLKTSGTAHEWQKLISKKLFNDIDFGSIHGRALTTLVSSKFIENNGLVDIYSKWIEAQPIAKFTGYVHELAMKIKFDLPLFKKNTLNKQFDGLVKLAQDNTNVESGLIVVRDTSGSMTSEIHGQKMSSNDVAKALSIFFGDMLKGKFANSWIEFSNTAIMHIYTATNFVDKWLSDRSGGWGSTNFLSVIDLFVTIKNKGVDEADFPTGILCISDGEFNPGDIGKTNVESALLRLRNNGFSQEYIKNFKIVLWNIPNAFYGRSVSDKVVFETYGDTENVYYMSGYDGSILSFLLGGEDKEKATPKTAAELFEAAMDQEVLQMIEV